MGELHPSPTARQGNVPCDAVTRGLNADLEPYAAAKEVWCRQCGFRCNLERDARGIEEFSGEEITSGNVLSNSSFETWVLGAPSGWTVSGTTVTQETTSGYFDARDDGVSSAKIVRSGSNVSLSQSLSSPSSYAENIVSYGVRMKSLVNSIAKLRLVVNGTNYDSRYNVAGQTWWESFLTVTMPSSVSSISAQVIFDNADGTVYIDSASLCRDGAPTTASVAAGCPHCGSYSYF